MDGTWNVEREGGGENMCRLLLVTPAEMKEQLEWPRYRWDGSNKNRLHLEEIELEGTKWVHLPRDRD